MTDDTTRVKPISRRLRFEILRRDNQTCRYCGATAPDVKLAVDHVIPRILGGTDAPDNLVTACVDCNSGKSSTSPTESLVADVSSDALRWAEAMRLVALERSAAVTYRRAAVESFREMWDDWTCDGTKLPMDAGWEASIGRFLDAGLTLDDLHHLIAVAMKSKANAYKTWTYFCGCCWRELDTRQTLARELLNSRSPDPTCPACEGLGVSSVDGRYAECPCRFSELM